MQNLNQGSLNKIEIFKKANHGKILIVNHIQRKSTKP